MMGRTATHLHKMLLEDNIRYVLQVTSGMDARDEK
jgi:hypothetical protein